MSFGRLRADYSDVFCDLLIVGAGPSGLVAASLLSRYGISFRIIDKKLLPTRVGRADCGISWSISKAALTATGINSRTLEVLESMGLQHNLNSKGCKISEYAVWGVVDEQMQRVNIGTDVTLSTPFPWTHVVDNGDFEQVLVDDLSSRGHIVEYKTELLGLSKPRGAAHRTAMYIKNHDTGAMEKLHASFVLACDGPDSSVRESLGIMLEHFGRDDTWVVMDTSESTNFPDRRRRCTTRYDGQTCVVTPKMSSVFRTRTLLSEVERRKSPWNSSHVSLDPAPHQHTAGATSIAQAFQTRVLRAQVPYGFQFQDVRWVDQYTQRKSLAKSLMDPTGSVFLVGSAAHTHSPLTKQAINSSCLDALNLCWKIAYVLRGAADRSILASYESERRSILAKAIEFDCRMDHAFSLSSEDEEETSKFHNFEEASGYTSGLGIRYPYSRLIKEERRIFIRKCLEPLTPGKRLLPAKLIRHIDGNEVSTMEILKQNGRFSLIYFAADYLDMPIFTGPTSVLNSDKSPLLFKCHEKDGVDSSMVDLILIHAMEHTSKQIEDLPLPWSEHPMNIFEDPGGSYHVQVGLSHQTGGLCLVRPDGYLAIVSNVDNTDAVTEYLRGLH